ncbi:hypothetical protein BS50DRAFT_679730 [Corynespora cassiicola Philippines]|uniref:Mannosyl phosphorylinositol ceramide synthase SUR1 n=1 Tax=Corynespora cassiicola Philippines TaxID=1448308 RepID=A0A2T2NDD7_CORCC|nr:hypothetical protein BS50DRAFT_679730 [Corynespora cassiicola Philippines]
MATIRYRFLLKLLALVTLFYGVYCAICQHSFQKFLGTLNIGFDDFPLEYARALNESVSNGQQPTDFNYTSVYPQTKIPRTIHYIWFKNLYESYEGHTKIPSMGSRSPEICREHNPDYEIRMWNASSAREFFETEYKWFLPTYDGYRYPIQRIDALKYFVLWHYGGVYMDLDIACRRPLDPLLAFPAWFPEASPLGVNNDLMASAPRHPILRRMTEGLVSHNWNLLFPYLTIFWTTGPQFTSDILREWYGEFGGRDLTVPFHKQNAGTDAFFVLPQIFYSEEYTFFGHSPGGTWHGSDVAVILWLVDRLWVVIGFTIAFVGTLVAILKRRQIGVLLNKKQHYYSSV